MISLLNNYPIVKFSKVNRLSNIYLSVNKIGYKYIFFYFYPN